MMVLLLVVMVLASSAPAAGQDLVAIGTHYEKLLAAGHWEVRPLVLRRSNGAWQRIDVPSTAARHLTILSYAQDGALWAAGGGSGSALLLRSQDHGVSSEDVSYRVASVRGVVVALRFAGEFGTLVALAGDGATALLSSVDRGARWESADSAFGSLPPFLLVYEGLARLLVQDGTRVRLRSLQAADGLVPDLIDAGGIAITAATVAGTDIWVAASHSSDAGAVEAIVYRGNDRGWDRRSMIRTASEIRSIQFMNERVGFAGGVRGDADTMVPFIAGTHDAGESWRLHDIPPDLTNAAVTRIGRAGHAALAAVNRLGAPGCTILAADGYASPWSRAIPDEGSARIRDFVEVRP